MASFLSKLFGRSGGTSGETPAASGKTETYGDYLVRATPRKEGSQYRLVGAIEHKVGEETRVRSFIRADIFSSEQDAIDATFRKARQIVDQHGPSLFGDGELSRPV